MKKIFYLLAISLLMISCVEKPLKLNVMSFNIRLDHAGDSLNSWQYRKDVAGKIIKDNDIDVLGTQEVLLNQLNDLKERLPEYTAIGVGRDDGKEAGEFSAIFYKKDKFTEVKSGNFWLSETPDIAGSKGWDASYVRVATWAILKDKESTNKFLIINTHLDNDGLLARIEGGNLLLEKAKELGKDIPVILTGDFNDTPDSETIKNITNTNSSKYFKNSRTIAAEVSGTDWTFHDFGRLAEDERPCLDYIFVSNRASVSNFQVLADSINGIYISDHKAIMATIQYFPFEFSFEIN
ncbi:endonuclease/exonuclease/phosphatase family protein [Dysgonomonas sp. Marseille-P4677]|uniref:endonuclease/exonuclease/phosphatase family protein n=1 Tax=Dysgonomonas sp. Marseille-P4677 TaxID=2364790 RepID=UPI0019115DBB|nr:endonuclease/exonuclease/phosphatase family protein [Dysgonomonas sp. Marseille-P4677]MBK5720527.1 endonuclease/exonuclease/phosphatase family protein [Dysgonomonas sp. Marseille-P4677]